MTKGTKTFLLVSLITVACLAAIVAAGAYWWHENKGILMEGTKTAITEGQKSGEKLDENGCVSAALKRHTADGEPSVALGIKNSIWLTACLDRSKPVEKFCEGVPSLSDYTTAGGWTSQSCTQRGLNDLYCPAIFQSVIHYCSSPHRDQKLKKLLAKEPAADTVADDKAGNENKEGSTAK